MSNAKASLTFKVDGTDVYLVRVDEAPGAIEIEPDGAIRVRKSVSQAKITFIVDMEGGGWRFSRFTLSQNPKGQDSKLEDRHQTLFTLIGNGIHHKWDAKGAAPIVHSKSVKSVTITNSNEFAHEYSYGFELVGDGSKKATFDPALINDGRNRWLLPLLILGCAVVVVFAAYLLSQTLFSMR